ASEKLILMAVKVSVVLCGTAGAGLAITTSSVQLFWIMSADVMYCMMAPQVICIFYLSRWVNYLGACFGFVLALLLRVLVGEPVIGLPDLMPLPWDKIQDDGTRYRLFPFRTAILLITLGTIFLVSRLAECLFEKRKLGSEDETDATCPVSLLTMWSNRITAANSRKHQEFMGRVSSVNNKFELYQQLKEENGCAFLGFVDTSARELQKKILDSIESNGFDLSKCRGQEYDGAANMSG
ncbi:hypothetical protein JOQ06_026001, partial [Pogonophryne albipinna]